MPVRSRPWRLAPGLLVALLLMSLSGCWWSDLRQQVAAVGTAGRLTGRVTTPAGRPDDVLVTLFRRGEGGELIVQSLVFADHHGRFSMFAAPGDYYVAAFLDRNKDARYQAGEPGLFHGEPTALTLPPGGVVDVTLSLPARSGSLFEGIGSIDLAPAVVRNIGRVTSLDDPRFSAANVTLGLWKPADFLAEPGGGLFLLEPYAAGRVPVIFVHGMNGSPLDFEAAIRTLDRDRYQPWVLYYPTGLRLDMVSDYLVTAVRGLQVRHRIGQFAVVAHSMGGLVARSFVQKFAARHPGAADSLRLVVTVNSPMAGLPGAALGVEHSPLVVPSWQDIASGSGFLAGLEAQGWPDQVPYHLVFSYSDSESGDGTVPLASQLPLRLQAEARRVQGFRGTHTSTLRNPAFLALLGAWLDEATQGPPAGRGGSGR